MLKVNLGTYLCSMQANDTYFLESGDKIRYFFETDAFDASGKLQYKKVEFVKE